MPLNRLIWHAETTKYIGVKVVFTDQQYVSVLEEHAALGTLDDAMVVCARDSYNF